MSIQLVEFLNANKITVVHSIPSFLTQLVELKTPIPTLRFFGVTSAPVPEEIKKEFKSKINSNLYVCYGTNETGTITIARPSIEDQTAGLVGKPASTIQVEIVDTNGILQPKGQAGQIRVRVPGAISS